MGTQIGLKQGVEVGG
jgi:hypothetical protein